MAQKTKFRQGIVFAAVIVIICAVFAGIAFKNNSENALASEETVITLTIGDPNLTLNGNSMPIDDEGTSPVIVSDRTLMPVRAIIEAAGGTVSWDDASRTASLTYSDDAILLTIDSTTAYLNDTAETLDVAPVIINDRTMLPIRFISESFGFTVEWDETTQTVTITITPNGEEIAPTSAVTGSSSAPSEDSLPTVYMTTEITPESLVEVYNAIGFEPEGNVAVKMSTGEPPNSNYLRPELIGDLIQNVNGTIVECNTAYGGSRSETAMHRQVIEDHGFNDIANVDIMDEDGSMEIPIEKGVTITKNYVGSHLANYDSMISLAHFKGHAMAGFGGAIKNMSIGVASSEGKCYIHSAGESMTSPWGGDQDAFCESMAEAASSVTDYLDGKVVYINVMNNISIDCDCDGNPSEPDMHDVGILASTDPVALDQACIDIVYATDRSESGTLIDRIESRNGLHTLEHAAEIGYGSREYELVSID